MTASRRGRAAAEGLGSLEGLRRLGGPRRHGSLEGLGSLGGQGFLTFFRGHCEASINPGMRPQSDQVDNSVRVQGYMHKPHWHAAACTRGDGNQT